jgi:hypothetical protein
LYYEEKRLVGLTPGLIYKYFKISLQTAIFQFDIVEALHADNGEEVVDEEEDDDRGRQPRDKDHGRAEHVAEPLFHPE